VGGMTINAEGAEKKLRHEEGLMSRNTRVWSKADGENSPPKEKKKGPTKDKRGQVKEEKIKDIVNVEGPGHAWGQSFEKITTC